MKMVYFTSNFFSEDEEIRKVLEGSEGLELENFFLSGYQFLPLDPVIVIPRVFETWQTDEI